MSKGLIRILIMDDSDEKIEAIKKLLISECGLVPECVEIAKTLNTGRNLLRENYYDLLILDLVMPTIEGEDADHEAAPTFIEELYEDRDYHLPNQILGCTAYEEEYENLKKRFDDKLWALIKYQAGSFDWKPKIRTKVNYLKNSKEMLIKSINLKNKCDIAILCALDEEFEELKQAFGGEWSSKSIKGFPLPFYYKEVYTGLGNTLRVIGICIGHPGLISSSTITTNVINVFHPDRIFMTGFAAGFTGRDLKFGDIVIGRTISEPVIGKISGKDDKLEFKKERHHESANALLLSMAQSLCSDDFLANFSQDLRSRRVLNSKDNINVLSAPVVSVPFVVGSNKLMTKFQADGDRKLSALDMEGAGFYYAANLLNTPCLWIKAISDLGDEHKDDSFHKTCSFSSAYFLYKLIKDKF